MNESSTKDKSSKIHKRHTHGPSLGDVTRQEQVEATNSTQKKSQ